MNSAETIKSRVYFLLALALLAGWIIGGAWHSTSLWADSVEQFNWAHSAELGYWKHPPLSTWLLICLQQLFGRHLYDTHILTFICLSLTFYFYWKIAESLIGSAGGILAVFMLGLNHMFTHRAQLYNHNIPLIMMVSCTVWLVMRAERKEKASLLDWILVGVSAGLAMLAKYQAIIPLIGLIFSLGLLSKFSMKSFRTGMAVATLAGFLVCIPHLYWTIKTDFMILKYSTQAVRHEPWVAKFQNLLSFYAQQFRNSLLPLASGLAFYMANRKNSIKQASTTAREVAEDKRITTWLFGLLYFPVIASVALNQFFGVKLMNHWGVELLLFFPLWVAYKIRRNLKSLELFRGTTIVALLHILSMAAFLHLYSNSPGKTGEENAKRKDLIYPAKKLTDDALNLWRSKTDCPLLYVGGFGYQAGLISIYSGKYPKVFEAKDVEEIKLNPWISQREVIEHGAIIVYPTNPDESQVNIDFIPPKSACDRSK